MRVWDIRACEEYEWQDSKGLYASLEAARRSIPQHTEVVHAFEAGGLILALPKHAEKVKTAYERGGYWWYSLPRHGHTENYDGMTFYGIFPVKVSP